jgi:hypothetical protein
MRGCQSPGTGPDHRAGVELAAMDAHRAAEIAADLEFGIVAILVHHQVRGRVEIQIR